MSTEITLYDYKKGYKQDIIKLSRYRRLRENATFSQLAITADIYVLNLCKIIPRSIHKIAVEGGLSVPTNRMLVYYRRTNIINLHRINEFKGNNSKRRTYTHPSISRIVPLEKLY